MNINSSGIYNVNAYNLSCKNATVLSSLNVSGSDIFSLINNSNIATNNNLNSLSTYSALNISNLNASTTTLFNKTNFSE